VVGKILDVFGKQKFIDVMGEKRGNTGKLENPYNDNGVLEVYHEEIEQWIRVTSREFRSWGGKRRITEYRYPYRQPTEISMYEYTGPVFEYLTNKIINNPNKGVNGSRPKPQSTYSERI
jgi:hypothetical protein